MIPEFLHRRLPTILASGAIGALLIALYAGIDLGSMHAYGDLRPFSWYPGRDPGAYFRPWQLSGLGNTEQLPPSELLVSTIIVLLPFPVALQHVMFLAEIPLATVSMYIFSKKLTSSWCGRSAAALFYGINPLTLQEFAGGSMGLLWVYVWLPIIAACMIEALGRNRLGELSRLALACAVASLFYPHAAAFVFGPVLLGLLLFHLPNLHWLERFRRVVVSAALGTSMYVLLLAPSFVDLISGYAKIASFLPNLAMADLTTTYANSQPWNAFRLLAVAWTGTPLNFHGYNDLTVWGATSTLLPITSLCAPLLVHKMTRSNPVFRAAFVLIIAVVAFDVATLTGLLVPAFVAFPILLQYRSPVKLNYVLSLSLSILLGFVLADLSSGRGVGRWLLFGRSVDPFSMRLFRQGIAFSVVFLITATAAIPFYGGMGLAGSGGWPGYTVGSEYLQAHQWLNGRRSSEYDFRTLWVPLDYPTFLQYQGLEKFTFDVPLGADLRGDDFQATNFIAGTFNAMCARDRSFLLNLSLASVRFIVVLDDNAQYPGCTPDDGLLLTNANFLNQFLGSIDGLVLSQVTEKYRIYENQKFVSPLAVYDRLFAVDYAERSPRTLYAGANLIRNPDFENRLDSWIAWWGNESKVVAGCYSGQNCAQIRSSHEGSSLLKQRFAVHPNMAYEVQLWWTLENALDASVILMWYDNATAQESQKIGVTVLRGPMAGTLDWDGVNRTATAPQGAIAADLTIIASTNISQSKRPIVSVALPAVRPVFDNPGGKPYYGQTLANAENIPSMSLRRDLLVGSAFLPESAAELATELIFNGLPRLPRDFASWLSIVEPERAMYGLVGNWTTLTEPGSVTLLDSDGTIKVDFDSARPQNVSMGLLVSYASTLPEISVAINGVPLVLSANSLPLASKAWLVGNLVLAHPGSQYLTVDARGPNLTIVQLLIGPESRVQSIVTPKTVRSESTGSASWSFTPDSGYRIQIADANATIIRISQVFSNGWAAHDGLNPLPHFTDGTFNLFLLDKATGRPFVVTIRYEDSTLRQLSFVSQAIAWSVLVLGLLVPAGTVYAIILFLLPPDSDRDRWVRLNRDKLSAVLRRELRMASGRPILDVGCGPGDYLSRMADLASDSITIGVDLSQDSLARARRDGSATGLVRADATRLPFKDAVFGAVLAKDLLHHTQDPEMALSEIVRVTSPGGSCVVAEASAEHPFQRVIMIYGNHHHMTRDRLMEIVGGQASVEKVIEVEANPLFYYVRPGKSPMLFLWNLAWVTFQVLGRMFPPLVDLAMRVQEQRERNEAWRGRRAFNILVARRVLAQGDHR